LSIEFLRLVKELYRAKVVSKLMVVRYLVEKLGFSRSHAYRVVNKLVELHGMGRIVLRANYDLRSFGLSLMIIVVPRSICRKLPQDLEVPFIRSCMDSYSASSILVLYVPRDGVERISRILQSSDRIDTFAILDERYYGAPDLDALKMFVELSRTQGLVKAFVDVVTMLSGRSFDAYLCRCEEQRIELDVDLLRLARVLELDPLMDIDEVATKLGISRSSVRSYLESLSRSIVGIRVRRLWIHEGMDTLIVALAKCSSNDVENICEVLVRHPATCSVALSRQGFLATSIRSYGSYALELSQAVRRFLNASGCEVLNLSVIPLTNLVTYSIPYVPRLEFDPVRKRWNVDALERIVRILLAL